MHPSRAAAAKRRLVEISSDSGSSDYSDSSSEESELDEDEKLWRQQEREAEENDLMEDEDKLIQSVRKLW